MRLIPAGLIRSQAWHIKIFLSDTVSDWNHTRSGAFRVTAQEAFLVRGLSGTARVAPRWNQTSRARSFRWPLVGARRNLFTVAQPGSLIKKSNWPLRASKRPIREPLLTPHQIPF